MKKQISRRFLNDRIAEDMKNSEFQKEFNDSDLSTRLAIQIAKLREKKGWTQKELAHKIKTKQQVISRIESSKDNNLTVGTLQKIAHAFDNKIQILFFDMDDKEFSKTLQERNFSHK